MELALGESYFFFFCRVVYCNYTSGSLLSQFDVPNVERVTEPQGLLSRVLWMPPCRHCHSQRRTEPCQYSWDITTSVPGECVRPLVFQPFVLHRAMAAPQRQTAASGFPCAIFFPQECSSLSCCSGVGKHHKQKTQSPFVVLLNKF